VIPRLVRALLNLPSGARLTLEVRGQQIVLSKPPAWKALQGAAVGSDLMDAFASFRNQERELENSRS
jgi:hypothetical protein